jgi:hypothetical protein
VGGRMLLSQPVLCCQWLAKQWISCFDQCHTGCRVWVSNWTGSGNGSYSGPNNPASITTNGPITETATFTHN